MSLYFLIVLFITFGRLGLQYSVLGSVWPIVYRDFGVALSLVGYVNMIIAAGRVVASVYTDRLVGKYGRTRSRPLVLSSYAWGSLGTRTVGPMRCSASSAFRSGSA